MQHIRHLGKDRKLQKLLSSQEPHTLQVKKNIYLHLCGSIMSQQLNTKVAAVIQQRFLALYGKKTPSAKDIVNTPLKYCVPLDCQMPKCSMCITSVIFLSKIT